MLVSLRVYWSTTFCAPLFSYCRRCDRSNDQILQYNMTYWKWWNVIDLPAGQGIVSFSCYVHIRHTWQNGRQIQVWEAVAISASPFFLWYNINPSVISLVDKIKNGKSPVGLVYIVILVAGTLYVKRTGWAPAVFVFACLFVCLLLRSYAHCIISISISIIYSSSISSCRLWKPAEYFRGS